MKLSPFRLHHPTTVDEASTLLRSHGFDAALIAGGTELVLLMKLGLAQPSEVIDVKGLDALSGTRREGDTILLGARTTYRQIIGDQTVQTALPELARVASLVANRRVQSTGTLVGNLCFADPHSDPAPLLMVMGAGLQVASSAGERRIPLEEFYEGPYQTALRDDELVTHVSVPVWSGRTAHQRFKLKERPAVTVSLHIDTKHGNVTSARLAVGCVEPIPRRLAMTEAAIVAQASPDDVAAQASAEVDPLEDDLGSVEYKRHIVGVMTKRALAVALRSGDST